MLQTLNNRPVGRAAFRRIAARAAFIGIAGGCAALLGSCNIVTPVAYAIEGPGKIDAEFKLNDKKTVVFVDDPQNIFPRTALRATLGDAVSFDLMERKVLTTTVKSVDAIQASRTKAQGDARKLVSVETIGRTTGASQVIVIQPTTFDIVGRNDLNGLRPTASVRVKVIDLDAGVRTFPASDVLPEGREVKSDVREISADLIRTPAGRRDIEEKLVQRIAINVARLFYEHDRIDLGENLGTRRK